MSTPPDSVTQGERFDEDILFRYSAESSDLTVKPLNLSSQNVEDHATAPGYLQSLYCLQMSKVIHTFRRSSRLF
jgi:hypothetical protein